MTYEQDMRNPTEVTDTPWIRTPSLDPIDTDEYIGKWLIFVPSEYVDKVWQAIRDETIKGNLGIDAKCATAKSRNPVKLICVYTKDYRDDDDLRRVLIALRKLGIAQRLNYKTDQATINLEYGPGSSLYTSPPNSVGFKTPKTRQKDNTNNK